MGEVRPIPRLLIETAITLGLGLVTALIVLIAGQSAVVALSVGIAVCIVFVVAIILWETKVRHKLRRSGDQHGVGSAGSVPEPTLTAQDAGNIVWAVEQRDKLVRQTLDSVAVARRLLDDPAEYRYVLRFGAVRGQHAALPIGMGNYFYVDVHAEPDLPANSCTAQLLRVERRDETGDWVHEPAFKPPEDMQWDGEPALAWPHSIEPDIPARLNLAYAWSTNTEPITYLSVSQRPHGNLGFLTPGQYRLSVRVRAEGASDLRGQFIVDAAPTWHDLSVEAATP